MTKKVLYPKVKVVPERRIYNGFQSSILFSHNHEIDILYSTNKINAEETAKHLIVDGNIEATLNNIKEYKVKHYSRKQDRQNKYIRIRKFIKELPPKRKITIIVEYNGKIEQELLL